VLLVLALLSSNAHAGMKSLEDAGLEEENAALQAKIAAMKKLMKNKDLKLQLAQLSAGIEGDSPASAVDSGSGASKSKASSDPNKYAAALRVASKAVKDLAAYYKNDKHILKDAVAKRGGKSEAVLVAKMALAMLEDDGSFKIAALGSSVTAGHDTFVSAAWPAVIERALKPTWDVLGVDFLVRNQAVGGRDPNPWPLCMPQMTGDDVDIIIREWEYWPFDAGIRSDMITKEGSEASVAAIEMFIRMALLTQKQPAVHFLKMSHEKMGGQNSWFLGWLGKKGALKEYSGFALQAFDAFGRPFDKLRKLTTPAKRVDNDPAHPKQCPPDSLANVANCPVSAAKPDGFHSRAKWLGYNETEHPHWKPLVDLIGQKNLFVNWHPAPLGHEVIGNQFAYYYLQLMVKALTKITKAFKGKSGDEEAKDALATEMRTLGGAQPLPNNVHCHDHVCKFLEGDRPKCAYSFLPKAMGPDVGDWMVNKTGGNNWVNKGTGESPCDKEGVETCANLHKKHTSAGAHAHSLRRSHAKKSVCSPEWPENGHCQEGDCVQTDEKCGYYDEKRGMHGSAGDQPLTLKVGVASPLPSLPPSRGGG
jgi:hypothetical protein